MFHIEAPKGKVKKTAVCNNLFLLHIFRFFYVFFLFFSLHTDAL